MQQLSYFFLSILFLFACTEEDELGKRPFPRVTTLEVINISPDGATFLGELTHTSVPITDHGFEFTSVKQFPSSHTVRYSLGARSGTGAFEKIIEASFAEQTTYFVRAYAKSDGYVYYGEVREFISIGSRVPVVESLEPSEGTWRDRIVIRGKYFSPIRSEMSVRFGDVQAEVVSTFGDSMVCVVPQSLKVSPVAITALLRGNGTPSNQKFSLLPPKITSIEPNTGYPGNSVQITGERFNPNGTDIFLGDLKIPTVSVTATSIKFSMPANLTGGDYVLRLVTADGVAPAEMSITVIAPRVLDVSPLEGTYGDEIEIEVENWNGDLGTYVYFGDHSALVRSVEGARIIAVVPEPLEHFENQITLRNGALNIQTEFVHRLLPPEILSVTLSEEWIPGEVMIVGNRFSQYWTEVLIDGVAQPTSVSPPATAVTQLSHGLSKHIIEVGVRVSGQEVRWPEPVKLPVISLMHQVSFMIESTTHLNNSLIMIGSQWGHSGVYVKPAGSDVFIERNSVPISPENLVHAFNDAQTAYYFDFNDLSFWGYDAVLNSWSAKAPIASDLLPGEGAFANGKGFVFGPLTADYHQTLDILEYDPVVDQWKTVGALTSLPAHRPFVYNNDIYWFDAGGRLTKFDTILKSTSVIATPGVYRYVFQRGDEIFITSDDQTITVFSMASKSIVRSIPFANGLLTIKSLDDGRFVYFTSSFDFFELDPDLL